MSLESDNGHEGSSSSASYVFHSSSSESFADSPILATTRNSLENSNDTTSSPQKKCRQTANNNERRRMQTINEGFRALSECVQSHNPKPDCKMSKANVLKLTVNYIKNVEAKYRELSETCLRYNAIISANKLQLERMNIALTKEHKLRLIYEQELVQMRMLSIKNTTLNGIFDPSPGASIDPNLYAAVFGKSDAEKGSFNTTIN